MEDPSPAEVIPLNNAEPSKAKLLRVKKPERPDKSAFDKRIEEFNKKIEANQERILQIKALFDGKQQNKQSFHQEIQTSRDRLAEIVAQTNSTIQQKKALKDELNMADETRNRMKEEAKSLRDKLPFVKVEQIDEEISKIDFKISHSSLSLTEEKKLVQQLRDLTKSRSFVKDYNDRMDRISVDEGSRSAYYDQMKEKDKILEQLKVEEMEKKAEIYELRQKENSQYDEFTVIAEERQAKYDEIKALREEIKKVKVEYRAAEDVFWGLEKEWRAQQADERKKQFEEREKRRQEYQEKKKQREAENYVEPFTNEIIICDQLVNYLQKLNVSSNPSPSDSAVNDVKKEAKVEEGGLVVLKKKRDDEVESWFGCAVKGKKGKSKSKTKNDKVALSLDILNSFGKINVTPPVNVTDALSSLEAVKVKKEEFLALQVEEREKKEKAEKEKGEEKKKEEEEEKEETEKGKENVEENGSLEQEKQVEVEE